MKKIIKPLSIPVARNIAFYQDKKDKYFTAAAESKFRLAILTCPCSKTTGHFWGEETYLVQVAGGIKSGAVSLDYGIRELKIPTLLIVGHSGCEIVKMSTGEITKSPEVLDEAVKDIAAAFADGKHRRLRDNIIKHLDNQVSVALERYVDLVKDEKLTVAAGVYDENNTYGNGYGKLYITNINGLKGKERIALIIDGLLADAAVEDICL